MLQAGRGFEAEQVLVEKLGMSIDKSKAFEEMHAVFEPAVRQRDRGDGMPAVVGREEK